jgi:tetratricopeptide (TPR) repeat protein
LIRSTALADLSLPRRQRLHLRVADAIERRRAPALDAYVSALAHHLYQAGAAADSERAITTMLNAMRRAHASGAFEEALAIGEQLDSYDLRPDSDEDLLRDELRADALWGLARLQTACEVAGRLLDAAIRRGNARLIDWTAFLMGNAFLWGGREDLALATYQKALAGLPSDAEAYWISLLSRSSNGLWGLGRMREADATAREAATLATRIGDNQSLATARSTQLFIASSTGLYAAAVRLADEVLGLAGRAEGGLSVHGTAYIVKAIALPALGRASVIHPISSSWRTSIVV